MHLPQDLCTKMSTYLIIYLDFQDYYSRSYIYLLFREFWSIFFPFIHCRAARIPWSSVRCPFHSIARICQGNIFKFADSVSFLLHFLCLLWAIASPCRSSHHMWIRSISEPICQAPHHQELLVGGEDASHLPGAWIHLFRQFSPTPNPQRHWTHPPPCATKSQTHHTGHPVIHSNLIPHLHGVTMVCVFLWFITLFHHGSCRFHPTHLPTHTHRSFPHQRSSTPHQRRHSCHTHTHQEHSVWQKTPAHSSPAISLSDMPCCSLHRFTGSPLSYTCLYLHGGRETEVAHQIHLHFHFSPTHQDVWYDWLRSIHRTFVSQRRGIVGFSIRNARWVNSNMRWLVEWCLQKLLRIHHAEQNGSCCPAHEGSPSLNIPCLAVLAIWEVHSFFDSACHLYFWWRDL